VDARTVWWNYAEFKGNPFMELIAFSDCGGTIGPASSAKLAKDFTDHREAVLEKARSELGGDLSAWFCDRYDDWQRAFATAAQGGFVMFH
jgi:hypothetical protein